MDLYIVNINDIKNINDLYLKLSKERQEKADKFKFDEDKKRSIISSYLIDKFSGEGILKYNEYGKPYKDNDIYFNVSHSFDYVIIGISNYQIGVDIEKIKDLDKKLAEYVFDFKIDNAYDFYLNWTKKESLIKYYGKTVGDIKKPIDANNIYIRSYNYFDYIISISSEKEDEINIIRLYELGV